MGIFAALCVGADLYLIVKTRFHYTVDIVMAIVITLLIYTNAGMALLAQWYASDGKRNSAEADIVWLPAILIPFCCLHGYYSVREMEDQQVADLQANNESSTWQWLTETFKTSSEESLSPEQVQSYGSAQTAPKSEAEVEGSV